MTPLDYIIDSLLVLLVLAQIRERELTTASLVRPVVIVSLAVAKYLHGIPTAGNDLLLIVALALTGTLVGMASGQTVLMRAGSAGRVLARAGWSSAFFWVLGMGSRFGFAVWVSHGGAHVIGQFSATHAITSAATWTAALLAMAASEVAGRTIVLVLRRHRVAAALPAASLA